MKNKTNILILWCVAALIGAGGAVHAQVGTWRYHFAAMPTQQLTIWGNEIYASHTVDVLCYNTDDHTLTTLSKRNGLSDSDIGAIAYHAAGNCLVVGYKDGNIDLYYGGHVFNMPDIKEKAMADSIDKAIYRIHTQGAYAYIACGFGIIVVDVMKQEFKETYFIGPLNGSLRVNEVNCDDEYIWAATEQGLRFAGKNAINLNDYTAWTVDTFLDESHHLAQAVKLGDTWWVLEKGAGGAADRVYMGQPGGAWTLADTTDIKAVTFLHAGVDAAYVARGTYRPSAQQWSVDLLSGTGELLYRAAIGGDEASVPGDALLDARQNLWTVGAWGGIMRFDQADGHAETFSPYGGPAFNTAMTMTGHADRIYLAAGGYDGDFAPIEREGTVSVFDGREWRLLGQDNMADYGQFSATVQVLEDPFENGHYYLASAVDGLLEIRNNRVVNRFTEANSPLQAYDGDVRVYGIAFDAKGNVWMTNPGSSTALLTYRRDGTWQAYDISDYTDGLHLGPLMVDYWQHIWVIDNNDNVYVFEVDGPSIKGLQIDENNGSSVTTSRVYCMLEDEVGHVWLGTERGVKLIDRHAEVFDNPNGRYSSVACKNIMVLSGVYLIALLHNETIRTMVYDGANRKWIGTETNGVFLVSPDGTQELAHYTADNSNLLSDQIAAIGMIPYTGEVFMSTGSGICSYMGTGSFREEGADALPFPNPVPPGYDGYISIRNLPTNAEVKITDAAGHMIYEGRATGSQLSWDGFNMQGKRPQSGVLLVFAATSDGSERMVCKIFYAR